MKRTVFFLLLFLFIGCSKEQPLQGRPYAMVETLQVQTSTQAKTATFTGEITYKKNEVTDCGFRWILETGDPMNEGARAVSLGVPSSSNFTHTIPARFRTSNGELGWYVRAYVKSNGFTFYGPLQYFCCPG